MPEGPEVKILSNKLQRFVGSKLVKIEVLNSRFDELLELEDYDIVDIISHGKAIYMMINRSGMRILKIHLMLHGKISFEEPSKYLVVFKTNVGNFWIHDRSNLMRCEESNISRVPDIMAVSEEEFVGTIKNYGRRKIGLVLKDQKIFEGVGAYLGSEIFYNAQLDPNKKINTLSNKEILNLYDSMNVLFDEIIAACGSSKYEGSWDISIHRKKEINGHEVVKSGQIYWVPDIQK